MVDKWHWKFVFIDFSDYCWSYILKEKSELKDHLIELINELDLKCNSKVKFSVFIKLWKTSTDHQDIISKGEECNENFQFFLQIRAMQKW